MRSPLLKDLLTAAGARFSERFDAEVVSAFSDPGTEAGAVRDAVGLTDMSHMRAFAMPEETGLDYLDALLAGNVPRIRFGRILHTFLADDDGMLAADCYVANNDEEIVFALESIRPDAEIDALLSLHGESCPATELTAGHAILGLDGFHAWDAVKTLFSADVLGLPYLSIENVEFEGEPVRLLRAGKTAEFGYLLIVPRAKADALFTALKAQVDRLGGRLCGVDAHDRLRLEGRFFNVFAEGQNVRDPLQLGLQWMIDLEEGNAFRGDEAIRRRREAGLKQKIVGLAAEPGSDTAVVGAPLFHGGTEVGSVVASGPSHVLDKPLALGLLPVELAYVGLGFQVGAANGPTLRSISMPPIIPRSLTIKLDEM